MPIKGLSERRRFSRGGKIRLGQKAVSQRTGREYPEKSDHYIFDPEDASLTTKFIELFGEKPRRLKVAFASEDPEQVFPQHYKLYGSSGLICKGDGQCAMRRNDEADLIEVECPGPENCDFALARGVHGKPGCKQVASLQFFIPDLPVMQVFQIDTSSYNSIINLNSQLDVLRRIAGRISFLPVDLILKPQEATNPETGKKIIIYVLDLVVGVGLAQIGLLRPLDAQLPPPIAPPPSDALPEDLYPRSQIQGLPAPTANHNDDPDDNMVVDPETGEIIETPAEPMPNPDPEPAEATAPATAPETGDISNDPDVLAALKAFPPAKRRALLSSATAGNWTKEQLLDVCSKQGNKATSGPRAERYQQPKQESAPPPPPPPPPSAPGPKPKPEPARQPARPAATERPSTAALF